MAPSRRRPNRDRTPRSIERAPRCRRGRPTGLVAWLTAASLSLLASGGCGAPTPAAGLARAWASGPVSWLLLPDEAREIRRIRDHDALTAFQREFWRRRAAPGESPEAALTRFQERVVAADRLYPEGDRVGSLTERGGALILLGAPGTLRHARARLPKVTTAPGRGAPRATSDVRVEVWVYEREALPAGLREQLGEGGGEVVVSFLIEATGTRLLQGRDILELAARAAVRSRESADEVPRAGALRERSSSAGGLD